MSRIEAIYVAAAMIIKRRCEAEELDSLSIEVADYASGLMWNSRKQKTKITSIIYFINGRQRQFRRGLIASARARSQAASPSADHSFTD